MFAWLDCRSLGSKEFPTADACDLLGNQSTRKAIEIARLFELSGDLEPPGKSKYQEESMQCHRDHCQCLTVAHVFPALTLVLTGTLPSLMLPGMTAEAAREIKVPGRLTVRVDAATAAPALHCLDG